MLSSSSKAELQTFARALGRHRTEDHTHSPHPHVFVKLCAPRVDNFLHQFSVAVPLSSSLPRRNTDRDGGYPLGPPLPYSVLTHRPCRHQIRPCFQVPDTEPVPARDSRLQLGFHATDPSDSPNQLHTAVSSTNTSPGIRFDLQLFFSHLVVVCTSHRHESHGKRSRGASHRTRQKG